VGVSESLQLFKADSGVGQRVRNRGFKRGICPEFKQNLGG
jgi:hypothetical protein